MGKDCLFCKIIKGEISSEKVFENDNLFAFKDIKPKAPVHVLVCPKKHIESLAFTDTKDSTLLGEIQVEIGKIAKKLKIQEAFKVQVNNGKKAGQEIDHLHYHLLGGWK